MNSSTIINKQIVTYRYYQLKQKFCVNANDFGYCKISACINYDEK